MTLKQFYDFIQKQNWKYAKTYASFAPHEYIVKQECEGTPQEFEDAVKFIRDYGFIGNYYSKQHAYFYLNKRFYWTMGEPIEDTIILNRCDALDYKISFTKR